MNSQIINKDLIGLLNAIKIPIDFMIHKLFKIDWTNSNLKPHMNDAERALLYSIMFSHGLVPIEEESTDMNKVLSQLGPVEARRIKRKFRKVWRKLARAQASGTSNPREWMRQKYGMGVAQPGVLAKKERKRLVVEHFEKNFVRPTFDALASKRPERPETAHGPTKP